MVKKGKKLLFTKAYFVSYEHTAAADELDDDHLDEIRWRIEKDAESAKLIKYDDSIGIPLVLRIKEVYHGGAPFTTENWYSQATNREGIVDLISNHALVAIKQLDRFSFKRDFIPYYEFRVKACEELKSHLLRAWYLVKAFGEFSRELRYLKNKMNIYIRVYVKEGVDLNPPAIIEEADSVATSGKSTGNDDEESVIGICMEE